ncbi:AbrB/MazE/SpoVT family DNA-binding domain-containing protein [Deinococcus aestuarii]|uniref:AbrB/MazE/SpoVT family DNA-binding domain-containing protein n=1 Tax=Deinococcus aestuarii TaxID=2774531 RepID=UPI001C0A9AA5|nr:hypothetical protein [Deinococcus aestuarii]
MDVHLRLRKWGGGRGTLWPKAVLDQLGMQPGDALGGELQEGQVVLRRIPRYQLKDLVKGLEPEKQHDVAAVVPEPEDGEEE